ncbi:MAG: RHS repeat domain-containing protein, partial [bacterium]
MKLFSGVPKLLVACLLFFGGGAGLLFACNPTVPPPDCPCIPCPCHIAGGPSIIGLLINWIRSAAGGGLSLGVPLPGPVGCPTCSATWQSPLGVPELTVKNARVRIRDTPIWFDASVGPRFSFEMRYNNLDNRGRTNQVWSMGYKWQHIYACYVETAGNYKLFQTGGGDYYRFAPAGGGAYAEVPGDGIVSSDGAYFMSNSGNNILIRIRGGGAYEFAPDGSGSRYRLIAVRDRLGAALTLNYDANNTLTSIVTASSNVFNFSYSAAGYLTNVLDVAGNRSAVFAYTND